MKGWMTTKYAFDFKTENNNIFAYIFHLNCLVLYLQMCSNDLFVCLCPLSSDSCQTFLLAIFSGFPWDSSTCAAVCPSMSWTSYFHFNQGLVSQVCNFNNPEDAQNGFIIEKVSNRNAFPTFHICILNFTPNPGLRDIAGVLTWLCINLDFNFDHQTVSVTSRPVCGVIMVAVHTWVKCQKPAKN